MTDDTRPSFFEVYASQHLSSALRPAFKFVFEVLSVRNPRLICLSNWSEEIFSVILFILETSNLRNESSLLAESFYSLRRSQQTSFLTRNINDKPISHRQVLFSLTVSVVIPYFKEKLDSWCSEASGGAAAPLFINQFPGLTNEHENQQVQIPSISQQPTTIVQRLRQLKRIISAYLRSQRFKLLVLKYYPRIRAFCEGINLLFHLLYLHGHSRFFSTSLALQGLILRRLQSSDLVQLAIKNESNNVQAQTSYLKFFSMIMKKLFVVLKGGFFAAIFAFRFLQFYYSAEASAPRETGPAMPPPEPLPPANRSTAHVTNPTHCPICQKNYTNPTACRTSGYVFCYLCILQHVQNESTCPVTFAPTSAEDLVRVYDDAM